MPANLARSHRGPAKSGPAGAEQARLKVGELLASKYRVVRVLGEGGMGVIVEAYHELLDQRVAVKLLYQDVADREAQSRLLMEARSAAKVRSEHVARVIDVDVGPNGLPFIVMELLEGSDLCQVADARGALPRWLVVDYVLQAHEGLAHAHVRGIIHRDLKPSNLFLADRPDGTQIIKILDFGISKSAEPTPDRRALQLTGGRTVLGSPPYMSPEQVRSPKTVDPRTDIWALGVSMYELLTNAMPFGGDEVQETFAQILERDPAPLRGLVSGLPSELEAVVMKCLAKRREDRFADVAELARALVPFGSGSWIQSAERVQATLARGAVDETAGTGPHPSMRRIPSAPRSDGGPELNGTASSVARAYTRFESRGRVAVALVVAAIGAILGVVLLARAFSAREGAAADVAREGTTAGPVPLVSSPSVVGLGVGDPPPAVLDVGLAATAGVAMASVENDLPASPLPNPTLLGASPAAPPSPSPSVAPSGRLRPARPPPLPQPPRSDKRTPAASAKTLPAGLPQDRSGQ